MAAATSGGAPARAGLMLPAVVAVIADAAGAGDLVWGMAGDHELCTGDD